MVCKQGMWPRGLAGAVIVRARRRGGAEAKQSPWRSTQIAKEIPYHQVLSLVLCGRSGVAGLGGCFGRLIQPWWLHLLAETDGRGWVSG